MKTLLSICGAALVCGLGFQAKANTLITNAGPGIVNSSGSDTTWGYDFTVGLNPLMITSLGLWDGPNTSPGSTGDGFDSTHEIGLWDISGNLLATTTMQMGTVDPLIGEFRYSSVLITTNPGPVILSANTTYVLGAHFISDSVSFDTFRRNLSGDQATFDPAVSAGDGRFSGGTGFNFPSGDAGPGSFVGPNAMFTSVPDGGASTLLLMVIAMVVVFGFRGCAAKRATIQF
jgi:hypothetical protein